MVSLMTNLTAWLLCIAIFAGIRNVMVNIEFDDHEGVVKWTVLTLLFGLSLLISLFA